MFVETSAKNALNVDQLFCLIGELFDSLFDFILGLIGILAQKLPREEQNRVTCQQLGDNTRGTPLERQRKCC